MRMNNLNVTNTDNGVVFRAKIVPGSSRTSFCGLFDGMLKIKIAAPPEKGKANKCLVDFLAKILAVKKNAIAIISGQTSPVKQLKIVGISARQLAEKLGI